MSAQMKEEWQLLLQPAQYLIAIFCLFAAALSSPLQPTIAYANDKPAAGSEEKPLLSLTSEEQAMIWRSLGGLARKAEVPAGLHIGEVVPGTMHIQPFAHNICKKVPALKFYSYVLAHDQILIIDSKSNSIISIVGR